jgi:hypothetical protein
MTVLFLRITMPTVSCLPFSLASAAMTVHEAARSSTGSSTAPWQHVEALGASDAMMDRGQASAAAACHKCSWASVGRPCSSDAEGKASGGGILNLPYDS